MKPTDINTTLIDGYLQMLDQLSPILKLDLISKLSQSIKAELNSSKKTTFYQTFSAWDSKQSAHDNIVGIRKSKTRDQ